MPLMSGSRLKEKGCMPVNMHVKWSVCFEPSWLLLCLQQCDTQFVSYRWFLVNTWQDFNSEAMSKRVISSNHCLLVHSAMDPGFSVMSDSGFSFLSSHGKLVFAWTTNTSNLHRFTCLTFLFFQPLIPHDMIGPSNLWTCMSFSVNVLWVETLLKIFCGSNDIKLCVVVSHCWKAAAHPTSSSMLFFTSVY